VCSCNGVITYHFFSDRRGSAESSRRCLALSQHSSMTAFHEHAFTGPVNRTANCVDPGTAARLPTLWLGFLLAENNQRCLEPPLSLASATPFRAPYSLSETPELLQVLPWLCTPSHLAAIASLRPLRFHRPASCGHHPPPHMADRGVNLTVIVHARIQRLVPNEAAPGRPQALPADLRPCSSRIRPLSIRRRLLA
jgi:hypothetical protein